MASWNAVRRMRMPFAVALAATAVVAVGAEAPATASDSATGRLVGRWQRVTTCQGYVAALAKAGLRQAAPAILSGNGLVPGTPQQLAKKTHICSGATPRLHARFFDRNGQFGSLDWKGQQVDDGPYRILPNHIVRIGPNRFRYRMTDGKLRLTALIPAAVKREALATPLKFSTAGWMVAVAYGGQSWKRVACGRWC